MDIDEDARLGPIQGTDEKGACEGIEPHRETPHVKGCYKFRSIGSKGAVLVLFISVAVDTGYYSVLNEVAEKIFTDANITSLAFQNLFGIFLIGTSLPQLFYPLAGWIADARIGRYRVTQISMWLVFIGHCVLFFPFLFLQLIDKAKYVYYIFPVAYLVINAGLAGFRTNIIQFGMDQMVGASGSQLSAFIHWYYWSTYVGSTTASFVLSCLFSEYLPFVIGVGISVVITGAALFCWYSLRKWLVKEPISINPFKTVYKVLLFSSKHNAPIHRSSLTYWEDTKPSRLDLGKSKYGGPFTTEEVENVKTFFSIILVLVSLGGFLIINDTYLDFLAYEMNNPDVGKQCSIGDILASQDVVILIAIPTYEVVICPLFRNYIPTTLKKIGIGIIVGVASVASALVLDLYIHEGPYHSPNDQCILLERNFSDMNSTISSAYIIIPVALDNIAELLVFISIYEFIFAQSPYGMRSMLVGTFYNIQGVFAIGSLFIGLTVAYSYKTPRTASCGTVYLSVAVFFGIVGLVVYTVVARKYQHRLRDEHIDQHLIVENYYLS